MANGVQGNRGLPLFLEALFGVFIPFGLGLIHTTYWVLLAYCVLYALVFNSGRFRAVVGMEAPHLAHDGLYWALRLGGTIVLISIVYEVGNLLN